MKPGYLTTEFWTVVFSYVLGFFVMGGTLTMQQASDFAKALAQIAVAVVIIVGQVMYIYSRLQVKKALASQSGIAVSTPIQTVEQNPLLDQPAQPVEQPVVPAGQQASIEGNPLL